MTPVIVVKVSYGQRRAGKPGFGCVRTYHIMSDGASGSVTNIETGWGL